MSPWRALTVRQPWASMILVGSKPAEFRSWRLPNKYLGLPVLLHAGRLETRRVITNTRLHDPQAVQEILQAPEAPPTGALIGIVVFGKPTKRTDGLWAWPVQETLPLIEPVRCPGALRFWQVPSELDPLIKV